MSVFLLFRSKKNMKISYLQFALYLLPRIDELAHFILCPFLQKYSKRRTLPSVFFTLLSPSKKNGEPHGQPRAVSCRRTTKLSCPQTKKLICMCRRQKLFTGGSFFTVYRIFFGICRNQVLFWISFCRSVWISLKLVE